MKLISLILVFSISCPQLLCAQQTKGKKSYPANIEKIGNIKAIYSGCTLGECYTWWKIALKDNDELLMQSGAHYPAGARSRHVSIGTWTKSGDTLYLNIIPASLDTTYMSRAYRITNLYDVEILLPLDNSRNWNELLKEIQMNFEQNDDYKALKEFQNSEILISKLFFNFVRFQYSAKNKLLVEIGD